MKQLMLAVVFLFAVALPGLAQDKKEMGDKGKEKAAKVMLSGYVVDAMCAKGMAKKDDPMMKAKGHTKSCALEEDCAASGFGVFSEGKYYKFDEKGDAMAKDLIEKTSTEKGIMVDVAGSMDGERLVVASVKEHTAQEKSKSSAK